MSLMSSSMDLFVFVSSDFDPFVGNCSGIYDFCICIALVEEFITAVLIPFDKKKINNFFYFILKPNPLTHYVGKFLLFRTIDFVNFLWIILE